MLSWDEFDKEDGEIISFYESVSCSVRRGDLYASSIRRTRDAVMKEFYAQQDMLVGGSERVVSYWGCRRLDVSSFWGLLDFLKGSLFSTLLEQRISALAAFAKVVVSLWLQSLRAFLSSPFSAYDAELSIRRHRLRTIS